MGGNLSSFKVLKKMEALTGVNVGAKEFTLLEVSKSKKLNYFPLIAWVVANSDVKTHNVPTPLRNKIVLIERQTTVKFVRLCVQDFDDEEKEKTDRGCEFVDQRRSYVDQELLIPAGYEGMLTPKTRALKRISFTSMSQISILPRFIRLESDDTIVSTSGKAHVLEKGQRLETEGLSELNGKTYVTCKNAQGQKFMFLRESPLHFSALPCSGPQTLAYLLNTAALPKSVQFETIPDEAFAPLDNDTKGKLRNMLSGPTRVICQEEQQVLVACTEDGNVLMIPKSAQDQITVKLFDFRSLETKQQYVRSQFPSYQSSSFIENKLYFVTCSNKTMTTFKVNKSTANSKDSNSAGQPSRAARVLTSNEYSDFPHSVTKTNRVQYESSMCSSPSTAPHNISSDPIKRPLILPAHRPKLNLPSVPPPVPDRSYKPKFHERQKEYRNMTPNKSDQARSEKSIHMATQSAKSAVRNASVDLPPPLSDPIHTMKSHGSQDYVNATLDETVKAPNSKDSNSAGQPSRATRVFTSNEYSDFPHSVSKTNRVQYESSMCSSTSTAPHNISSDPIKRPLIPPAHRPKLNLPSVPPPVPDRSYKPEYHERQKEYRNMTPNKSDQAQSETSIHRATQSATCALRNASVDLPPPLSDPIHNIKSHGSQSSEKATYETPSERNEYIRRKRHQEPVEDADADYVPMSPNCDDNLHENKKTESAFEEDSDADYVAMASIDDNRSDYLYENEPDDVYENEKETDVADPEKPIDDSTEQVPNKINNASVNIPSQKGTIHIECHEATHQNERESDNYDTLDVFGNPEDQQVIGDTYDKLDKLDETETSDGVYENEKEQVNVYDKQSEEDSSAINLHQALVEDSDTDYVAMASIDNERSDYLYENEPDIVYENEKETDGADSEKPIYDTIDPVSNKINNASVNIPSQKGTIHTECHDATNQHERESDNYDTLDVLGNPEEEQIIDDTYEIFDIPSNQEATQDVREYIPMDFSKPNHIDCQTTTVETLCGPGAGGATKGTCRIRRKQRQQLVEDTDTDYEPMSPGCDDKLDNPHANEESDGVYENAGPFNVYENCQEIYTKLPM